MRIKPSVVRTALLAGVALLTSIVHAQASAPSVPVVSSAAQAPFPVSLAKTAYMPPVPGIVLMGRDDGGLRLTWRSTVPGLSFCVAYASARGLYTDLNHHCLVADRHGEAVDTVHLGYARNVADLSDVVLVANAILVNNRVSATVVPVDAWTKATPKPSR